MPLSQTGSYTK
ncbi:hypothetical protein F383_31679 [Gossypium arboreum]|nr:hypothetical protein F383_31679 [Gossypium arboreum]